MIDLVPCPICGQIPKFHKIGTGLVLSCVGSRHSVVATDDGHHQVSLYRGKSQDELVRGWNKAFSKGATDADPQ